MPDSFKLGEKTRYMLLQPAQTASNESEDEDGALLERHVQKTGVLTTSCLSLVLGTILVSISTFLLISFILWEQEHQDLSCGASASEALARGCIYDLVPNTWLNKNCYDEALENELLDAADWKYYLDANLTIPITVDELRKTASSETHYWVFPGTLYHDKHCVTTWRKFHRALFGDGWVDGHIGALSHTWHCASVEGLLRDRSRDEPAMDVEPKFSNCLRIEELKGRYDAYRHSIEQAR